MARLALVAMLLLALLPTLGRLAAGTQSASGAAGAGWAAMCTAAGLREVPLASPAGQATFGQSLLAGADHGFPHDIIHQHDGPDCAYCPLLASLTVLALVLSLLLPLRLQAPGFPAWWTPRRKTFHPCGLGSRGPPIAP